MYISETVKDQLKQYEGQAVEIDALEVVQPDDPGDGLIRRLKVLGPAETKQTWYTLEGNTLNVQQGGHPCPCLVTAVQLVMSTEPTITITLKNGRSITASSTVNVYLEAPHGMSAIQLQKPVQIIVHAFHPF